jgi:signal transduction histidine kinase
MRDQMAASENAKSSTLLNVKNLWKSFGELKVVRGLNFTIQPGEVIGLSGSTGSGKSVLVMLLAGLYAPDMGQIVFKGKNLAWPYDANKLGIGVIHQRPTLEEGFDITSNIFLGNEIKHSKLFGLFSRIDREEMDRQARVILKYLGVDFISLREKVANLSGEQRQMIAIARVMTYPVDLVIIDVTTLSLRYPFQRKLLELIQHWREQNVAVIFSSNDLDHLFSITDRLIILNQGRKVVDERTDLISRETVFKHLLGAPDATGNDLITWDFDSFDYIRENFEKLSYHRMLLEKELASEGTLNRQLTEQLVDQFKVLDQTNRELRSAQKRLFSERESERKFLARELHDQIIQDLLGINYQLEDMGTQREISAHIAKYLVEVRGGIRELVDDLRRICGDLRPPTIDSLGLRAALQSFTQEWCQRTGIDLTLEMDSQVARLPEEIELPVFRIVQEGLNNVWKHAKATEVKIDLLHTSPRMLRISIQDNGCGVDKDLDLASLAAEGHYGLLGISERVANLSGRIHIDRSQEKGFHLVVEIPHPRVGDFAFDGRAAANPDQG